MFLALVVVLVIVGGLVAYAILKAPVKPAARSSPALSVPPEQRGSPQPGGGSDRRKETPEQATNTKRQDELARDAERKARVDLLGRGFTLDLVGARHENFRRLYGGRRASSVTVAFTALVVPDPESPLSKSGVAIMVAAEGVGPIGHFSEEEARRYRGLSEMLLTKGAVGACPGWLVRGYGEAPSISARLSIMRPEEILGGGAAGLGTK